ncbi:MAG: hypothetical protein Q4B09_09250 [Lachnospiraceae bacterium]|nr:hypothetical protein [Lachnospiraceae bacterium]
MEANAAKRVMNESANKGQVQIADLIFIAVLLAAGAVLRLVSSSFTVFGMKPNFMIAMYCLAIIVLRPKLSLSAVIGILAGVLCQISTPSPFLNIGSELIGAVVCGLLIKLPLQRGSLTLVPAVATFIGTFCSGFAFIAGRILLYHSEFSTLAAYVPIVIGTAVINTIIVCVLYAPCRKVLNKD